MIIRGNSFLGTRESIETWKAAGSLSSWFLPFWRSFFRMFGTKAGAKRSGWSANREKPITIRAFTVDSQEVRWSVEAVGSLFAYD
jgi:hypothetical protein